MSIRAATPRWRTSRHRWRTTTIFCFGSCSRSLHERFVSSWRLSALWRSRPAPAGLPRPLYGEPGRCASLCQPAKSAVSTSPLRSAVPQKPCASNPRGRSCARTSHPHVILCIHSATTADTTAAKTRAREHQHGRAWYHCRFRPTAIMSFRHYALTTT